MDNIDQKKLEEIFEEEGSIKFDGKVISNIE